MHHHCRNFQAENQKQQQERNQVCQIHLCNKTWNLLTSLESAGRPPSEFKISMNKILLKSFPQLCEPPSFTSGFTALTKSHRFQEKKMTKEGCIQDLARHRTSHIFVLDPPILRTGDIQYPAWCKGPGKSGKDNQHDGHQRRQQLQAVIIRFIPPSLL